MRKKLGVLFLEKMQGFFLMGLCFVRRKSERADLVGQRMGTGVCCGAGKGMGKEVTQEELGRGMRAAP